MKKKIKQLVRLGMREKDAVSFVMGCALDGFKQNHSKPGVANEYCAGDFNQELAKGDSNG